MSRRLLLVAVEAADAKLLNPLMDSGALPAINEIVESGFVGALLGCQPLDAATLWTTAVTGKRLWQHGVTKADSVNNPRSVALWSMLAKHSLRTVTVGWPASRPEPSATSISAAYDRPTAPPGVHPWPPAQPGVYSPDTLRNQFDPLRVSPEDISAELIARYIPEWRKADQKRDPKIGRLRVLLARDLCYARAAEVLLRDSSWQFAAVRFPGFGEIAHLFLPFYLTRRNWVTEHDFNLYRNVVDTACRSFDQTFRVLRQVAGPDSAVLLVACHGTREPNIPPNGFPANFRDGWKSPYGFVTGTGPGFASDALLHGASILDLAPTLLTWFGLPIGNDMEGRVLLEAFQPAPEIKKIPSWDDVAQAAKAEVPVNPEASWNIVQSLLEAGRLDEALPRLESLFRSFPERADFAYALFQSQIRTNQLDGATKTLEVLVENLPPGTQPLLAQAELAVAKREWSIARSLVSRLSKLDLQNTSLRRRYGLLLLRVRQWHELAQLARASLAHDENDAITWLGLAAASLRLRQFAEAEEAAKRAIQLQFVLPDAHFLLARALLAQGKWDEADHALAALRKLQPDNQTAAAYERRVAQRLSP